MDYFMESAVTEIQGYKQRRQSVEDRQSPQFITLYSNQTLMGYQSR